MDIRARAADYEVNGRVAGYVVRGAVGFGGGGEVEGMDGCFGG
jgi:hypothetical protein